MQICKMVQPFYLFVRVDIVSNYKWWLRVAELCIIPVLAETDVLRNRFTCV